MSISNPGQCSLTTSQKCQHIADNRNPRRQYHDIRNVRIESVQLDRVTFSANDVNGARRTYGPETWGNEAVMWVYCPSSLPSNASDPGPAPGQPGPPPAIGATGTLYIEAGYCTLNNIELPPGASSATPKFPTNL